MFLQYKQDGDFVGMDMARKFLQMGWTRARRYANHKGGRKYDPESGQELPRVEDLTITGILAFWERVIQSPY